MLLARPQISRVDLLTQCDSSQASSGQDTRSQELPATDTEKRERHQAWVPLQNRTKRAYGTCGMVLLSERLGRQDMESCQNHSSPAEDEECGLRRVINRLRY